MKAAYEKPVILRLETGYLNKFGSSPMYARKVRKDIDGAAIDALVEEFGSPLFVFSERVMREKYREVHEAFATRYPNVVQAWSYKTNYLQAVCSVFHDEGALAEVVSEFEYDKARKLGVPGSEIIFNGPHKPMHALRKAVEEGAQIHVDHLDEIHDLETLAQELGRQIPIGMRLNMDTVRAQPGLGAGHGRGEADPCPGPPGAEGPPRPYRDLHPGARRLRSRGGQDGPLRR